MTPFTIGIPVYNEEEILVPNIERLLAACDRLGCEYEVIVGSNGSTDATLTLGPELARRHPRVTFFHLPRRGVGRAFREFVVRARHQFLISVDMDLSVDLGFLPKVLELLETHDIVVGCKRTGHQQRSWYRKLASTAFVSTAELLLGMRYEDYSMAAKGFRVETLRRFSERIGAGSAYVLEMCFCVQRAGGRIVAIPVDCDDRRASRFNLWYEGVYKFGHLGGLWLRSRWS